MSLRRSLAIARNDIALLRAEALFPVVLVLMPLVIMAFAMPAYSAVLEARGHPGENGSAQVVPGMALMFVFFMVTFGGLAFFREHMWNTWNRLRMLPLRDSEIMLGKLVPIFALTCLQQTLLFTVGQLIFGFSLGASPVAFVLVDLAFCFWLVAFILLTVAFCKTFQQVLAISNLGAIAVAGIGGALTPLATLPTWIRPISPLTPTYWAMSGFNDVLLESRGVSAVLVPCAVLIGTAVAMSVVASHAFRFDARKEGVLTGF